MALRNEGEISMEQEHIDLDLDLNQNEAFTSPTKEKEDRFQTQSASVAPPVNNISGLELDINQTYVPQTPCDDESNATTKSNNSIYGPIPAIEITPADDDDNQQDSETNLVNRNLSLNKSESINMDWLTPPTVDTTINIARPAYHADKNTSRLVEDIQEINLETACHFSSTPVASPNKSNQTSDSAVSMLSISKASPIVPAEIHTPGRDTSVQQTHQTEHDEEDIYSNNRHYKYDNVFKENQIVTQTSNEMNSVFKVSGDSSHLSTSAVNEGMGVHVNQQSDIYTAANGNFYSNLAPNTGSEFHLGRDGSWTELDYQSPLLHQPSNMTDPCCFAGNPVLTPNLMPNTACQGEQSDYFVYPSIYVSSAGLISVLLRNDISVEMTVDRTIRVVSHNHMMAAAIDSRGTASSVYHPAVKVVQTGNTTDISTLGFRSQMGTNDAIVFSNGVNYFRLDGVELQPVAPMKLSDINRDQSVNLLFSSEGYGQQLVASCMQVAAQAEYATLPKGGVIIRINGVKVTQTGGGDVTVVTGAKFIRLSPNSGSTRLGNRFMDVEIEKDWTVKLTRGPHSFRYARKQAIICNGKMEAGFDENSTLKVTNLTPRHPLLADPNIVRRNNSHPKPLRPNAVYNYNHVPPHGPPHGQTNIQTHTTAYMPGNVHFTNRRRSGPHLSGFSNRARFEMDYYTP